MSQLSIQQKQAMQALLQQQGIQLPEKQSQQSQMNRIEPNEENRFDVYPLTDIQQSYLLGRSRHFVLGNVGSHAYLEFSVQELDIARYEYAWDQVVGKHDMLRTLVYKNGTQQTLSSVPQFKVTVHDYRDLSETDTHQSLQTLRKELSHQVIDVSSWPLFNIHISQIDAKHQIIHWSFDAIVSDVHSNFIFQEEIFRCYHDSSVKLAPLSITFRDYVLALKKQEESQEYERARDYWQSKISILPPAPSLPLKKAMADIKSPYFSRLETRISASKWTIFKQIALKHGVTPTIALLTVFSYVLARWGRENRFTLNLTLFNRQPWHDQMEQLVGDFTSTVLLAVEGITQQQEFLKQVKHLQHDFMNDLDHRCFSGTKVLQEWSHAQDSQQLVPVVFTSALTIGDVSKQLDTAGKQLGQMTYSITQTPQVLLDHQVYEDKGELCIHWDHIAEAFSPGALDCMFNAYIQTLEYLTDNEENWFGQLQVTLPETQVKERKYYNQTQNKSLAKEAEQLIHHPFLHQVSLNPDQIAVINGSVKISYLELKNRAWLLAQELITSGLDANDRVAVILPKGWEQVVAVLAISAAGGVYVPVDSNSPRSRIKLLIEEAGCKLTICADKDRDSLPDSIKNIQVSAAPVKEVQKPDLHWPLRQNPEDLAYIIYTSGSTGKPKGVMMSHSGVVNTLLDINQRMSIDSSDTVFGLSALNFDLSVYDIFGTFAAGATLVMPEAGYERDPGHWLSTLDKYPCTVWNTVPALMQMLMESLKSGTQLHSLKTVMLSGDKIPLDLPLKITTACPNSQVISLGGATEAAIWSIFYPLAKVSPQWKTIPYGRPLSNQKFYVLDKQLKDCPDYVAGDLYIGGIGLAGGYWRDENKTQKHFIHHPQSNEPLYFTGDLGRFHPSSRNESAHIEFLGREDSQIKLGGHRIELGEIEFHLNQNPTIKKSVIDIVQDSESRSNVQRLVAYVVTDYDVDHKKLNQWLSEFLPNYMLPTIYCKIDSIPLSANGKVAKNRLPAPGFSFNRQQNHQQVEGEMETLIHRVICQRLNMEQVSVDDNFFDLGASSLDMVAIHKSLETELSQTISVLELFEKPNIRALSILLQSEDLCQKGHLAQAREARKNANRKRKRTINYTSKSTSENQE